jgi:hypothetical protein
MAQKFQFTCPQGSVFSVILDSTREFPFSFEPGDPGVCLSPRGLLEVTIALNQMIGAYIHAQEIIARQNANEPAAEAPASGPLPEPTDEEIAEMLLEAEKTVARGE